MKRLVWIVLAVFGAAFVQVQAVDAGTKAKPCSCCHRGACGTPKCCPLPVSGTVLEIEPSTEVTSSAASHEAAASVGKEAAYDFRLPRRAPVAVRAPAANVPLFRAHCSLLI